MMMKWWHNHHLFHYQTIPSHYTQKTWANIHSMNQDYTFTIIYNVLITNVHDFISYEHLCMYTENKVLRFIIYTYPIWNDYTTNSVMWNNDIKIDLTDFGMNQSHRWVNYVMYVHMEDWYINIQIQSVAFIQLMSNFHTQIPLCVTLNHKQNSDEKVI